MANSKNKLIQNISLELVVEGFDDVTFLSLDRIMVKRKTCLWLTLSQRRDRDTVLLGKEKRRRNVKRYDG